MVNKMLIKVFSQEDCDLLMSLGCKRMGSTFVSNIETVDCFINMYVPVEKIEEVNKLKVNFINTTRLTF